MLSTHPFLLVTVGILDNLNLGVGMALISSASCHISCLFPCRPGNQRSSVYSSKLGVGVGWGVGMRVGPEARKHTGTHKYKKTRSATFPTVSLDCTIRCGMTLYLTHYA